MPLNSTSSKNSQTKRPVRRQRMVSVYFGDIDPRKNSSWGIYRVCVKLLKELLCDEEIEILLITTTSNYSLFEEFKCEKIALTSNIKISFLRKLWLENIKLKNIFREKRVEIAFFPRGPIPFLKSKTVKYFSYIHDLIPIYYLKKGYLKFLPVSLLLIHSIKKSNIIFTNSFYSKRTIEKFNKGLSTVIVAYPGYRKVKPSNGELVKTPYFYIIGNANPHKNLERTIDIFLKYNKEKRYAFRAVITSGLPDSTKYENVIFLGKVKEADLANIYKNAVASIFLSDIEGFGLPLIESYIYNTPIVFNNKTALKEIGKNLKGKCDIEDHESVFAAIEEVLALGDEDIEKVKSDFMKQYNWAESAGIIIREMKKI